MGRGMRSPRRIRADRRERGWHQATIWFDPDQWEALTAGAMAEGVSTAEYIRESARARLLLDTGQRSARPPFTERRSGNDH